MVKKIIQFDLHNASHSEASSQPLALVSTSALCFSLEEETSDRAIFQGISALWLNAERPYLHGATIIFQRCDILRAFIFSGES